MLVRRATPADAAAIAALQLEAWRERMNHWAPPEAIASLTLDGQTAKYAARATDPAYTLLVAIEEGTVAAFAASRPNAAEPKQFAREISAVYTATPFARQGAATTLLNVMRKDPASQNGLVVWTFRDNAPARALYKSCGATLLPNTDYPDFAWGIPHVSYGWNR